MSLEIEPNILFMSLHRIYGFPTTKLTLYPCPKLDIIFLKKASV